MHTNNMPHAFHARFAMAALAICALYALAPAQELDSASRARKAKEYFISGTTLQIQGNRHAEAILEFQQSLRYDSSVVTLTAIARSYRELKKLDLALENVNLALGRDKTSREAWELLAEIEILRGRYDEGLAAYERILDLNPTKRQLYTLARLYEPRSALRAIEIYERIVATSPDITMFMRLSELYQRTKNTKGRVRVLAQAAKIAPTDPQIAAEQCEMFVEQAQFDELISILQTWNGRSVDVEMSTDVWLVALSRILEDSLVIGLYSADVVRVIDLAQTTLPQAWPVMVVAGTVSMAINDTGRAASCFMTLPDNALVIPEGYLEIGRVYGLNNMPQRAIDFLSFGRTRFATDIRFPILISSLYMDLGNDRQAIIELEGATILDSASADVWVQLGMLYDRTRRIQESDQAYEKALQLDPSNPLANNNYAYSLSLRRIELERAQSMGYLAVQADSKNAAFLDTYAWILYQREDFDAAKQYITLAIQYGGNATHFEHYGMILKALGERNAAVRAFERSLEIDPARTWVRDELERLTK
ncbi:MAG: hypothetical protein RLZZ273_752 [Bacteroidota bacterium]